LNGGSPVDQQSYLKLGLLCKALDANQYRYNNRATKDNPLDDRDRFMGAISQIAGKRLTYRELTGNEAETDAATLDA
jgi:hypothetical protein